MNKCQERGKTSILLWKRKDVTEFLLKKPIARTSVSLKKMMNRA